MKRRAKESKRLHKAATSDSGSRVTVSVDGFATSLITCFVEPIEKNTLARVSLYEDNRNLYFGQLTLSFTREECK